MERWIDATDAATDESRGQSVVFYREPGGERPLRAYPTHDVRLEAASAESSPRRPTLQPCTVTHRTPTSPPRAFAR